MSLIAARYEQKSRLQNGDLSCRDTHLNRDVQLRFCPTGVTRRWIQQRLASLQDIRSPYLAMIYDLVEHSGRIAVVVEALPAPIVLTDALRLRLLYQFSAAVAALHEAGIVHGNLRPEAFHQGALEDGKLSDLLFDGIMRDIDSDLRAFRTCLNAMEIRRAMARPGVDPSLADGLMRSASAAEIRATLKRLLLRDKHRALLQRSGIDMALHAENRSAVISHSNPEIARFSIEYDGNRFFFSHVSGEIWVNGKAPQVNEELPSSCVIRLGDRSRPFHQQHHLTFDQSHPEVL